MYSSCGEQFLLADPISRKQLHGNRAIAATTRYTVNKLIGKRERRDVTENSMVRQLVVTFLNKTARDAFDKIT